MSNEEFQSLVLQQLKSLSDGQKEMRLDITELQQQFESRIENDVMNKLNQLQSTVNTMQSDISDLQSEVGGIKSTIEVMQSTLDEHTQLLKALEHRTEEHSAKLTAIGERLNYTEGLNTKVDRLENKLGKLEDKINKIAGVQTHHSDMLDTLILSVAHHNADIVGLKRATGE
jgi:chromosome segregation ATPase